MVRCSYVDKKNKYIYIYIYIYIFLTMIYTSLKFKKKKLTTYYTYYSNIFNFAEREIWRTFDLKLKKDVIDFRSSVSPFHIVADAYLKKCNP